MDFCVLAINHSYCCWWFWSELYICFEKGNVGWSKSR